MIDYDNIKFTDEDIAYAQRCLPNCCNDDELRKRLERNLALILKRDKEQYHDNE